MVEEKKNDGANNPISLLLEQALTSTYDQICDDFSLILPHLFVAISRKSEFFFRQNNFVALSTIQVCMETSTKLSLHVSPPSSSVNPMHHRNYDETSLQVQRIIMEITTKFRLNCDENLWQVKNLRRRCYMCDKKLWQLAMNTHGNSNDIDSSRPKLWRIFCMCDENMWQLAMEFRRYCHGGQNAFFFRRTIIDIATMALSF